MKETNISVIIPNYNGRKLLENNLPSVFTALKNSGLRYEVIIVDDCSKDDSIAFITQYYPEIILLEKEKNSGFSATCNVGITHAQYNYILLLNSDIQLSPNYFEGQMDYFKNADTFGVMSKIKGANDLEVQDTARLFSLKGFKISPNQFFTIKNPKKRIPTAYLSGANALVDAEKLKILGGFDEIFSPFYYEDFDLGLRAWRMGWKCYYHPDTFCLHEPSSTTKSYRTRNWVKGIYFRNKMLVHAIHLDGLAKCMWYFRLLLESLVMWLMGKFYFYRSLYLFFGNFAQVKQSRERLNQLMEKQGESKSLSDVQQEMEQLLAGEELSFGLQS